MLTVNPSSSVSHSKPVLACAVFMHCHVKPPPHPLFFSLFFFVLRVYACKPCKKFCCCLFLRPVNKAYFFCHLVIIWHQLFINLSPFVQERKKLFKGQQTYDLSKQKCVSTEGACNIPFAITSFFFFFSLKKMWEVKSLFLSYCVQS